MRRWVILAGGAAAAAGAVGFAARRAALKAEEKYPPQGEFVSVGKTRVHYVRKGSGPAMILIHGAGGTVRDYAFSLMDKLAKTHTVIAFDRPGHGYTDTMHQNGESPIEQAKLLHAAAEKLGVGKATIMGYSFGGIVALAWALEHPETVGSLVLVSAVINEWPGGVSSMYLLGGGLVLGTVYRPLAALAPDGQLRRAFTSVFEPQSPPEGYLDYIGMELAVRPTTMRANGRQVMNLKPHVVEMQKRYGELKMQIEVIHGTSDRSAYAEIHSAPFAARYDNAHYIEIEGMGHGTLQLAQDEILAAVGRIRAQTR
jgi:pimeloyl-ACP methyl ester carboxylesterase